MPQFDPTYFSAQVIWLIITFGVFYVLMVKLALPRIGEILNERQSKIDADLESASQAKKEAEDAAQSYESSLVEARTQALALVREANSEMSEKASVKNAELAERLGAETKAAEAAVEEAKEAAIANLKAVSSEVARDAVVRLAGVEVDEAAAQNAVEAAMKERR